MKPSEYYQSSYKDNNQEKLDSTSKEGKLIQKRAQNQAKNSNREELGKPFTQPRKTRI